MYDPTITLNEVLHVLEITAIIGGGVMAIYSLGRFTEKVEQTLKQQNLILEGNKEEIVDLKKETKRLGEVLIDLAVQHTRLDRVEGDIREMKHGQGFVQSAREYP